MGNARSFPMCLPELSRGEIFGGDHIYTSRGVFDHHVIHFQNSIDDKALGSSIPRHGPCSVCGHHSGRNGVVLSCLDCFLRGGKIYRYKYGCRPRFMPLELMAVCTSAPSDAHETVIDRAKQLLTDGFGDYNLLGNNCEDFSLFCKTGKHIRSGQVAALPLLILNQMVPKIQPFPGFFTDFDSFLRKKRGRILNMQ